MGGGALSSKNVSKLGSKGVSKNSILSLRGSETTVAIAKSLDIDEITTSHFANAPRNDKSPSEASEMNLTTYRPNDLTSFLNPSQPSLRKGRSKCAFTLAEVLITLGIIGVVAAMTLPSIIQNYQKKITVERLKKTYSTLSQAVQMSVKDNDDIENWDFSLSTQEFMDKYVIPYVKDIARENPSYEPARCSKKFALADGTTIEAWSWVNPKVKPFVELKVDINGNNKPNAVGRDIFFFHIVSQMAERYNGGEGDVAQNVPRGGLYPDGYGYDRNRLMTDTYRGCNNRIATKDENDSLGIGGSHRGAFCTELIMLDGWNISDDYKW